MLKRRMLAAALSLCLLLGTAVPARAEEPEPPEDALETELSEETPEALETSEPSEAPQTSEAPETPETPEIPETPEALDPPEPPAPMAAAVGSGTCGKNGSGNLTWTLDEAGTLTISGTGEMEDYTASQAAPWGREVVRAVMEEGVTSVGNYAFYQCKELSGVTLPDSLHKVGEFSFYECVSLAAASMPGVSELGTAAFQYCSSLASVRLDHAGVVGYSAFSDCTSLISIDLPNAAIIHDYAFYGCSSLASASFLKNAGHIGPHAFEDCGRLTNLVVPSNIYTITESVFSGCGSLASVTIPLTVEAIQANAFAGCGSLRTVYYAGSEEDWQNISVEGGNDILASESLRIYYNAGEHAVSVKDSQLYDAGAGDYRPGDRVTLHAGSLPGCVFAGWTVTGGAVLDDPNDPDAFFLMPNASVTATANWRNPDTQAPIKKYGDCGARMDTLTWTLDSTGTLTILGEGEMTDYHVATPAPWGDAPVRAVVKEGVASIGEYAFYNCTGLTSASLPGSAASIGAFAFGGCSELSDLTLRSGLTSIGDSAFHECSSLAAVVLPEGLRSIGGAAFIDCYGLASVTFPDGLASIGDNAFENCWSLESAVIPAGTSIGASAFIYCESLTDLTLSEGVTEIGGGAFDSCKSLASVTIPGSVKTMGGGVFCLCKNLTSVTFLDGVSEIGSYMFNSCTRLDSAVIPSSVTSIEAGAFSLCGSLKTVYYAGGEADWQSISIGSSNEPLASADIHFNTTPHTVSVEGSFAAASGAGSYLPGTEVTLRAGSRPGWVFTGWTVSGGAVLDDSASPDAVFVMPGADVAASAGWRPDILEVPVSAPVQSGGSAIVPADPDAIAAVTAASIASSGKPPVIFAARREADWQAGAVLGETDGSSIVFGTASEALDKIFFLEPETFIPLARPAVLP